ncbi:MAG TPA: TonB-dependent receptor [Gemmatimonadaceae bacterium]|nr:TonB-dependent receptor [Gemmatimonadaceae bacterium]
MRFRLPVALVAALLGALLPGARRLDAQQADVVRGRVIGPDSTPVEGARVTVTSLNGQVSRQAQTDKNGRFTVTFPNGEGDYIVSFAALGYAVKRFEVKRTADEEILVADAKLTRAAVNLDAMKVTAAREKVSRNDAQPDISGTERPVSPAALPPADLGDLAAMAATLPGVQLVPGQNGDPNGFSVLGLGADQNNMTLNGMAFGGSNLPRDAGVATSLVTSPYDVSRGGFSGGQLTIRSRPGSNFITRGMSLNLDAPQMQWTDRAAQALGQQYTNVSLGGLAAGPLVMDKAFYSIAYQLGRRANDYQNLLNTGPLGLQTAGVAADSVFRFLGILGQEQVPTAVGRVPRDRTSDQGSVFGSIDFAPPTSTTGQAFNVTFNGGWNKQAPIGGGATSLPASSGERTGWNAGLQTRHNSYFGFGILEETTLGVSGSHSYGTPYLQLPSGRVLVNSIFGDGSSGLQNLAFGGNQSLNTSQSTNSVGLLNQLSWFSANNKHRLKLTSELRRDAYSSNQTTNLLGTYSYLSLADLAADRPASFTRQLSPRNSGASQVLGAVSLGDAWRTTNDLQIQYGVRLDGNRFLAEPIFNPDLENIFGIRNDHAPDHVYLSPRLGFSWTYGTAPQVASFDGAARVPRAVVRGGVGLFQNMPQTTVLGQALDNTGLPNAVQQLNCVGPATPLPNWSSFADPSTIPTTCADGTTGSVFANSAPNAFFFAKDFAASRSVRSNLQWNGPVFGNRLMATIEGTYSRNLNQPGIYDLNFTGAEQFSLADEGDRPVYVQKSSIVPATGAIASGDGRVTSLYAHVTELRSDLQSESRQVSLRLSPTTFSTSYSWSLAYVYGNVRDKVRGFSSTVADPFELSWGRSSFDSRHQIVYTLGYNFFNTVNVSWYGQFRSGTPFTPMVAADVNGDGYVNDRAFVFRPGSGDPVAAGIQELLDHGSGAARDCLLRQLGNLAARNSCEGPWTSTANLSFTFNPMRVRMPQRATLSFNLSNPLGAADLLLHGSSRLHGWGQPASPDQSLLYVRGFDASSGRFLYEVNQRFGATLPALSAFRLPVTLTAMLRFDVGPTRERQSLTMQLDRGRRTEGQKMPEQFLRLMYGTGGVPNPMAQILRQQDSLHLTSQQADSIASLNRWYSVRVDSIWTPVAKYLSDLPNRYDQGAAYEHYLNARRASVDLLSELAPRVKQILTAEQLRKLPPFVAGYLEPRYLASIRSGTAAFTGAPMLPGTAAAVMSGAGAMAGAGGGGMQVIISRP